MPTDQGKAIRIPVLLLVAATTGLLVVSCSTTRLEAKPSARIEEALPSSQAALAAATPRPTRIETPPQPASTPIDPLQDPNNILARRSVYFDFNSSTLNDEFSPLIEAHARYLVEHPQRKIRIEGNCDERGGIEYNLALGQRRADVLARRLQLLGVSPSQIETLSYGEERPKALGHDEASRAQNRRDDIVYG